MITNESTEISQIVTIASKNRRTRKVIIGAIVQRAARPGFASLLSCLEVPGLGMRDARGAAVLGDAGAAGNVAQPAADDAHAELCRRLADGADGVLLLDDDLPDLLRRLVAFVLLLPGRRAEQLQRALQFRIGRRRALLAVGGIPLGDFHAEMRFGRVDRQAV